MLRRQSRKKNRVLYFLLASPFGQEREEKKPFPKLLRDLRDCNLKDNEATRQLSKMVEYRAEDANPMPHFLLLDLIVREYPSLLSHSENFFYRCDSLNYLEISVLLHRYHSFRYRLFFYSCR